MRRRVVSLIATLALVVPAGIATLAAMAPPAGAALPGNIETVAGNGVGGSNSAPVGDGTAATGAELGTPFAVAFDAEGNQIIADVDTERVRVVANSGANPGYPLAGCSGACTWTVGDIFTIAGDGLSGTNADGAPATTAHVDTPSGVAVDGQGNVLITDTDESAVRVLAMSASNPGYPLQNDCGGGSSACVWSPGDIFAIAFGQVRGVTFDAEGNPIIADEAGLVEVIAVSASNPGYPLGGACIPSCLWSPGSVFTIAGDNIDFSPGFNGDGNAALLTDFDDPTGVTIDSEDNPIIADSQNERIRILAVSASNPGYTLGDFCGISFTSPCTWTVGDVYTIAGTGPLGDEDGRAATDADVGQPGGVTIDFAGNPIIADTTNDVVQVLAVSASNPGYTLSDHCGGGGNPCTWSVGALFVIAGVLPPSGGFNGDGIPAPTAQLDQPVGVAVDASRNVYIADASNSRVREVTVGPFSVPANPGSANGFDTTFTSNGSITVTASGTWSNNGTANDPNGNGSATTGSFLLPSAPAGSLVGRIGTSGPWTEVGSGPSTVNGHGDLFLAMNDDPADFVNDTGSVSVAIITTEDVSSGYGEPSPIIAGFSGLNWNGAVTNDAASPLTNVTLIASAGLVQEGSIAWQVVDGSDVQQSSGSCTPLSGAQQTCAIGALPQGYTAEVSASFSTRVQPQTIHDQLIMLSDQTGGILSPTGVVAAQNSMRIDGVLFTIPVPPSVTAGTPIVSNATIANTSATQTIHGVTFSGSISAGSFTGVVSGCSISNRTPLGTGGTFSCPTPFNLGPGASIPGTFTVNTTGTGGDTIHFAVTGRSILNLGGNSYTATGDVVVPAALSIPATIAPVAPTITAGSDAAWTVQITNPNAVAAQGVTVTWNATSSNDLPLTFDEAAINGALGLPAATPTCAPAVGNTVACNLADIPAHSVTQFTAFAITNGLPPVTITGSITIASTSASSASADLGTVTVATCATNCTTGVAAPGDPFSSPPPSPDIQTQQVLLLTNNTAGSSTLPPVDVTLQSITPSSGEIATDQKLCPTATGATHCSGQISAVTAQFGKYVNQQNPIRVTIVSRWGASVPAGRILMEKNAGGDPIFLNTCVVDPTTRDFNVPCVLPEIVRGTVAASNLTTYDTVLFTGLDIHFARRTTTTTTVTKISAPAAPTAVTATAGALKATLHWKAPTVTNGAGVSGYVVTVLSAGAVVKTVTYATAALTQTITGLTNKTYTFKVAAKNVAGTGAASAPSAAFKPITAPAAPAAPTGTPGAARAVLHWKAPTVTNGGAVTGYVVTVLLAGKVVKTVTYTTAALTQTVTALTRGGSYTFKVAAKNIAGTGAASAPSAVIKPT